MGNVVTVFLNVNRGNDCYMTKWCHNAAKLQDRFNTSTTIITDYDSIVDLCPHARIIHINQNVDKILLDYQKYLNRIGFQRTIFRVYLHKIAVFDERLFRQPVIFLDTDVDVSIGRHLSNTALIKKMFSNFVDSPCVLQATADHSALVNDGIMLIKPNQHIYERAIHILANKQFNYTHGFEFKGSPKTIIENPVGVVRRAHGYWADTWRFVCGGSGQGLFAYLTMPSGEYCQPSDWRIRIRHFWGSDKPWLSKTCTQFFDVPTHSRCVPYWNNLKRSSKFKCMGRDWPVL